MKTMVGRAPDVEAESFRLGAFEQAAPIRASASSSKTNGRRREIINLPETEEKSIQEGQKESAQIPVSGDGSRWIGFRR
jgi:hypothetical protein